MRKNRKPGAMVLTRNTESERRWAMKMRPLSFAAIIMAFLLSAGLTSAQDATGRRVALVVGNGTYAANPLRNPPNDAEDVAAAFKDSGFEVSLVLNTSLEALEKAVDEFAAKLGGAETGLFYYAGHGVQVGGFNYLIPVSPRIDDEASVKSRAVAVDVVVGKMEASGVRTALVFLDSCRDNPFPGAGRSGTRGLAVVASPRTRNSLIAYATSPGDTAQDGSGRNGVFSGAFIKQLQEPGLELTVMMRNVRNEVASVSGNKQQPRVDDGMKEPFYFVSLDAVAAKARAERDKIASELAALEAQIAARGTAIGSARTAEERSILEVEQQKQKALEAAKRIESENARLDAVRLEAEASRRRAEDEERLKLGTAELELVASLRAQVEARRAEYDKLTRTNDSLDEFLSQIIALETALAEIGKRYASAATQAEATVQSFYDSKQGELVRARIEPWESSAEFNTRVARAKSDLENKRKQEISSRKFSLDNERADAERDLRTNLRATEQGLAAKTYTLKGSNVSVVYGTFDRVKKTWPVTVASREPVLSYSANMLHDISSAADLPTAFANVDTMLKAGAMAGEMDYQISRIPGSENFQVTVTELRVLNLTSGKVILRYGPNQKLSALSAVALRTEYLRNSIGSRLREAETITVVLRTRHEKAKEARKPFDRFKLGSFITGGAGALAAGVFYFLGNAAMQDYRSAEFASEAVAARQDASLYSMLFGASVVTAGLGLVTGGVAWMLAPDTHSIDQELNASIKKLAELRAEKEAAK